MTFRRTHAPSYRRTRVSVGFTLLETIIVMAVIGIVAAIAIPRGFDPGPITLKAQARNLASDLQQAQSMAISSGVAVTLRMNASSPNQYTLDAPAKTVTLENGVVFDNATGNLTSVQFDSLGQPSVFGYFKFKSTGSASASVYVTETTGLVTVP
jgi:type II secretion system protein H